MWKGFNIFKRKPFKEYEGSSDTFADAYRKAKHELSKDDFELEVVVDLIDILLTLMSTRGDGRLITELQAQLRLKVMDARL